MKTKKFNPDSVVLSVINGQMEQAVEQMMKGVKYNPYATALRAITVVDRLKDFDKRLDAKFERVLETYAETEKEKRRNEAEKRMIKQHEESTSNR